MNATSASSLNLSEISVSNWLKSHGSKLLAYVPTVLIIYLGHDCLTRIPDVEANIAWAFTALMSVNALYASSVIQRYLDIRTSMPAKAMTAAVTIGFAVIIEALVIGIALFHAAGGLLFYLLGPGQTLTHNLAAFAIGLGFSAFNVSLKWSMTSKTEQTKSTAQEALLFDLTAGIAEKASNAGKAELSKMIEHTQRITRDELDKARRLHDPENARKRRGRPKKMQAA